MKLKFVHSTDRWRSHDIAGASFDKHPWNYKTCSTTERTKEMRREGSKHLEVFDHNIALFWLYKWTNISLSISYSIVVIVAILFSFGRLKTELDKPLVVLLQWLMAKPKHIKKYAELYIDHGYDVMAVTVTPWQVMWPTKGTQVCVGRPSFLIRMIHANDLKFCVAVGCSWSRKVLGQQCNHKESNNFTWVLGRWISLGWMHGSYGKGYWSLSPCPGHVSSTNLGFGCGIVGIDGRCAKSNVPKKWNSTTSIEKLLDVSEIALIASICAFLSDDLCIVLHIFHIQIPYENIPWTSYVSLHPFKSNVSQHVSEETGSLFAISIGPDWFGGSK